MPRTDAEIREAVRAAYAERALEAALCADGSCAPAGLTVISAEGAACGPDGCAIDPTALQLGATPLPAGFAAVGAAGRPAPPAGAASWGCGDPLALGQPRPGEVVVDLGSGAGYDCFRAAADVGPTGRVIGVDMTAEMVESARRNLAESGLTNVEFRFGLIESLPIDDVTADVVISNCAINLAPDKGSVFREAFRILKRGGRLQLADMVLTRPLAAVARDDLAAWASCGPGALSQGAYESMLSEAGFVDVAVDAPAGVTPWSGGLISARKP